MNYSDWVLEALLILPLVAALALLLRPEQEAKYLALVATLAEFLVSVPLWWAYDASSSAMQFVVARPWIANWGIWLRLGLDGISLFMVLLTTFTMPLAVLGSWNYIKERQRAYYALLLVLTTGMLGVFLALDLFVFYVFWEIMLIPMYFLIGVWGGPGAGRAGCTPPSSSSCSRSWARCSCWWRSCGSTTRWGTPPAPTRSPTTTSWPTSG
jgi:NADH-quinone oxidoreductase subunit M